MDFVFSDLLSDLPELIGQAVETNQWLGYIAIFAAMFLENLLPPIPSELIMPLGGFYVQQGQLDLVLVVSVCWERFLVRCPGMASVG